MKHSTKRTLHGHTLNKGKDSREYWVWANMWQRCTNPKTPKYRIYGGRGITVCDRWRSFPAFLADMGPRPSRQHTLDRIDGNGNYEPPNCRWATKTEQARNTSQTHFITAFGVTKPLVEWSQEYGLNYVTILTRLKRGWSPEKAVTTTAEKEKIIEYNGKHQSVAAWAAEIGIDRNTLRERLRRGWSVEQALTSPLDYRPPYRPRHRTVR